MLLISDVDTKNIGSSFGELDEPSNRNVSTKLLCRHLLTLTVRSTQPPPIFFHPTNDRQQVRRVEILGIVVSRERKPNFLKFLEDDGTGVIPCIIWLNQNPLHWKFARMQPSDLELMAEMAMEDEETAVVGGGVRVRGQVCMYMSEIQIKVRDVMEERDPNAEIRRLREVDPTLEGKCDHKSITNDLEGPCHANEFDLLKPRLLRPVHERNPRYK